jgi:hypothetical protein
MYEKKIILKVSVPTLGTGGLNKILTVSVLYMGFSVRLHESKKKKTLKSVSLLWARVVKNKS